MLVALKERHSLAELAQKYQIHPTQISSWKRDFLDGAEQVFEYYNHERRHQSIDYEIPADVYKKAA
ncbi:hypothetical protein [Robiginitalea biformata]|uniref:hypothetical protein n=1 Tax=Robiginitalea biformata TaxID=252307 RepID=UPI003BA95A82